ncbi:MAG: hypothetical protein WC692_07355 [Erythrobacter sp.]|jgi:hypothetical protein
MIDYTGMDASIAIVDYWGLHAADIPDPAHRALRDAIAGRDALAN